MEIPGCVFPRRLDRPLPKAVMARGVWIEDAEGHRYLDASGGAVVVNVGHGREEIARAVYDQITRCDYVHGTMFTTSPLEELTRALAAYAPSGIERFYFLSSGSEAVETAIKLARQIHLECGRTERIRLIARWKSYHGSTLGALSATGRTSSRTPFAPLLSEVIHIPPPYCLRCSYGLRHPGCELRCALALEETVQNLGADTVSAFLGETVIGATLGIYPAPPGYWSVIREICDRNQVLLILDEVMCGLGRTGCWFACQQYGVIPDIVTLGKGLGGGAAALSAIGVQENHFHTILKGSGTFVHGGTYSHHAVAAAAGLAVVRIMEREHLVERAASFGKRMGERLRDRIGDLSCVADIRGLGLMWGVELAKDKRTLLPFPRQDKVAERLWQALFEKGVITYRSTGLAGKDGDALIIGPPFIIQGDELDFLVDMVGHALEETLH